jgi:hypothetical protein
VQNTQGIQGRAAEQHGVPAATGGITDGERGSAAVQPDRDQFLERSFINRLLT